MREIFDFIFYTFRSFVQKISNAPARAIWYGVWNETESQTRRVHERQSKRIKEADSQTRGDPFLPPCFCLTHSLILFSVTKRFASSNFFFLPIVTEMNIPKRDEIFWEQYVRYDALRIISFSATHARVWTVSVILFLCIPRSLAHTFVMSRILLQERVPFLLNSLPLPPSL